MESLSFLERAMTGAPLIVVLLMGGFVFLWRDVIAERALHRTERLESDKRYADSAAASQAAMNNMAQAVQTLAHSIDRAPR